MGERGGARKEGSNSVRRLHGVITMGFVYGQPSLVKHASCCSALAGSERSRIRQC